MGTAASIGEIDLELHRVGQTPLDGLGALLSPDERARADRFRQADDRSRYILGRGVLRLMLGRRLGRTPGSLRFDLSPHGKPILKDGGGIAFNVSHAGDCVLVGVGRVRDLGVDVERERADLDLVGVGGQVFTDAELALILGAPDGQKTRRFFRQWTFKEAVAKAVGLGLTLDFRGFEICFSDGAPRLAPGRAAELRSSSGWRLQSVLAPVGYSAALAARP